MQSNCKNRTLQWIVKQLKSGNISLSHKLQRKEGQWNRLTKSELIDSLLRDYPINPVYTIKEDNILSVIDGVQRFSTVRDYLADTFALSKNLAPVTIKTNVDGNMTQKEVSIAGKKFSKLDEDVKDILLACELQVYELTDCTEKDVREMFRRQNAGKNLNNAQLRSAIETDEMAEVIYSLTSHPLFDKVLTPAQRRKDQDKDIIRETLMLIETDQDHDYTSFKSKNINDFILVYQENIDKKQIETLKQAIDRLDEAFSEMKVTTVSLPMIFYVSYRAIAEKKSFSKLVELIKKFIKEYDKNEEYKQFCKDSTTSSDKVKGRLDYWNGIYKKL